MRASTFAKYNPYHDRKGRFANRDGAAGYSLPRSRSNLLAKPDPPPGVTVHVSNPGGSRSKMTSITGEDKKKSALKESLDKVESKIRMQPKESGVLVDDNGNILMDKSGGKSSVKFTSADVAKFRGNILTHNHPGGGPFSPADINTVVNTGLKGIRAVGDDNIDYVLKRNANPNNVSKMMDVASGIEKTIKRTVKAEKPAIMDEIRAGSLSVDEANKKITKMIHKEIEKFIEVAITPDTGWDYKRIDRN